MTPPASMFRTVEFDDEPDGLLERVLFVALDESQDTDWPED